MSIQMTLELEESFGFPYTAPSNHWGSQLLPILEVELIKDDEFDKPVHKVNLSDNSEIFLEPVLLEEMLRAEFAQRQDKDWMRTVSKNMVTRLDRLTEWMRWCALRGSLDVHYPDGKVNVSYPRPRKNSPTCATLWTDHENSDPYADLKCMVPEGYEAVILNSNTYSDMIKSKKWEPRYVNEFDWCLMDGGYRTEAAKKGEDAGFNKYVKDGEVFVLPDISPVGYIAQSSKKCELVRMPSIASHFVRVAAERIPVITEPEVIKHITVSF